MLLLAGGEQGDTLGGTTRHANIGDRNADQTTGVRDHHHLVGIGDRE